MRFDGQQIAVDEPVLPFLSDGIAVDANDVGGMSSVSQKKLAATFVPAQDELIPSPAARQICQVVLSVQHLIRLAADPHSLLPTQPNSIPRLTASEHDEFVAVG